MVECVSACQLFGRSGRVWSFAVLGWLMGWWSVVFRSSLGLEFVLLGDGFER